MIELINLPLAENVLSEYDDGDSLEEFCYKNKCDGIEAIWGGEQYKLKLKRSVVKGWHLGFYCDWVDFWNDDKKALNRKFGNEEEWQMFYGGNDKTALLEMLSKDLDRAAEIGAEYVVFHVSDVSVEECYTYRWLHTDEEIIDKSAEMINRLLDGKNYKFKFLMENLHWAGFNFTRPEITKRLLQKVNYKNKGIMLDIGHLMCTNLELKSEQDAVDYINKMLDEHGILCRYIKGLHLHKSLSGEYVKANITLNPELPSDYLRKFSEGYNHILKIDTHKPFETNAIKSIIKRVAPEYLVHELAASNRREKEKALKIQKKAIR